MLPTLSEILALQFDKAQPLCSDKSRLSPSQLQAQAESQWCAAVAATEEFLLQTIDSDRILSPKE